MTPSATLAGMAGVEYPGMTFDYGDERPDRATAVMQAVGAASTCWEHLDATGRYDVDRAHGIGAALLAELRRLDRLDPPLLGLATTDELLVELIARLDTTAGARHRLAHHAAQARAELPPELLAYRTVDEVDE